MRTTVARALNRYLIWFTAAMVFAAMALAITGEGLFGVSVVLGAFLVGTFGHRIGRAVGNAPTQNRRAGGFWILAVVRAAMPGAVLIFVGVLVGGDVSYFCVSLGVFYMGMAGLLIALARGVPG